MSEIEVQDEKVYPHKSKFDFTDMDLVESYFKDLDNETATKDREISLAGRVMKVVRKCSPAIYLMEVDGDPYLLMFGYPPKSSVSSYLAGATLCEPPEQTLRRGTIVSVCGHPGKNKQGQYTIFAKDFEVLSHCLHNLPVNKISDPETKYSKRFLYMIMDADVQKIFKTRARVIKYMRDFLNARGFIEVETPVLSTTPSFGAAKSFVALDGKNEKLYLRNAPECYLKQLVVGGMKRVYEIGKQFRNEDIDRTHHPEFTSCEFYMAYSDYEDLIVMTEELLSGIVRELTGSYTLEYKSQDEKTSIINFKPPFRRLKMIDELEKHMGVTIPRDFESPETNTLLLEMCNNHGIPCQAPKRSSRLIDKMADKFLGETCSDPTFILDHPQIMGPMAKNHRDGGGLTERFELFVNKFELINAYTEMNDPVRQLKEFEKLKKELAAGGKEVEIDEAYVLALEHGLPPTAGWGIGIDRLVMLLTGCSNIRDVICFPLVASKKKKLK